MSRKPSSKTKASSTSSKAGDSDNGLEYLGVLADAAIVAADTEIGAAFDRIIDATTSLMDHAEHVPEAAADEFNAAISEILEAAAMRDIAGQRLTAARKAVQDVATSEDSAQGKRDKSPKLGEKEASDGNGEDALLNGPQAPGGAPSQADIDALFDQAD